VRRRRRCLSGVRAAAIKLAVAPVMTFCHCIGPPTQHARVLMDMRVAKHVLLFL
jgi:hypothetical protein